MASKKLLHAATLIELYAVSKRYPGCFEGGGSSEEVSDDIVVMLDRHWSRSIQEVTGRRSDAAFISFVLGHIDATTDQDNLRGIVRKSKTACPSRAHAICRRLIAAATEAISEIP
jgi:hypothetical protein